MGRNKKDPREIKRVMGLFVTDEERYRLRHMAETWGVTYSQMASIIINRAYESGNYLRGYDQLSAEEREELVYQREQVQNLTRKREYQARKRNSDRRSGLDRGLTNVMVVVAPEHQDLPGVFCNNLGQVWIIPYGVLYRVRPTSLIPYPCFASVLDYFSGRRIPPFQIAKFIAKHRAYVLSSFGEKAVLTRLFAVYGKLDMSIQQSREIAMDSGRAYERAMAQKELDKEFGYTTDVSSLLASIKISADEQINEQLKEDEEAGIDADIDVYKGPDSDAESDSDLNEMSSQDELDAAAAAAAADDDMAMDPQALVHSAALLESAAAASLEDSKPELILTPQHLSDADGSSSASTTSTTSASASSAAPEPQLIASEDAATEALPPPPASAEQNPASTDERAAAETKIASTDANEATVASTDAGVAAQHRRVKINGKGKVVTGGAAYVRKISITPDKIEGLASKVGTTQDYDLGQDLEKLKSLSRFYKDGVEVVTPEEAEKARKLAAEQAQSADSDAEVFGDARQYRYAPDGLKKGKNRQSADGNFVMHNPARDSHGEWIDGVYVPTNLPYRPPEVYKSPAALLGEDENNIPALAPDAPPSSSAKEVAKSVSVLKNIANQMAQEIVEEKLDEQRRQMLHEFRAMERRLKSYQRYQESKLEKKQRELEQIELQQKEKQAKPKAKAKAKKKRETKAPSPAQ